ncbi:MAG: DUF3489 domain-containing protein [Pseudomonadota bacterium]
MTKATQSKVEKVRRLLKRKRGAKLDEIIAATQWKKHSIRAYISRLRKQGYCVVCTRDRTGASRYLVTAEPGQ